MDERVKDELIADLAQKLRGCMGKLRACAISSGTDPEFADVMLDQYGDVLARADKVMSEQLLRTRA